MNRYIEVDHRQLEQAASELERRLKEHKKYMDQASSEVINLSNTWEGSDSYAYQNGWEKLTNNESTYKTVTDQMQSYANFLYYCADQYKAAQSEAVNRARGLTLF